MRLIQYKPDNLKEKINSAFNSPSPLSDNFYRSLLEVVFSLCTDDFTDEVNQFAKKTKNPKLFSIAVLHIHKIDLAKSKKLVTKEKLIEKFGDFIFTPILSSLLEYLSGKKKILPPVTDLLAVTGLPFFITNGNTPQGIFSISGIVLRISSSGLCQIFSSECHLKPAPPTFSMTHCFPENGLKSFTAICCSPPGKITNRFTSHVLRVKRVVLK